MYSSNILILTYWHYEDALIQAYTLPYVKMIRKYLSSDKEVWFQTLEKEELTKEKTDSIDKILQNSKINWYPQQYQKYGKRSFYANFLLLIKYVSFCRQNNIKIIHIWCTPPGIIGYILSILTKSVLIIDSYEPHAETMVENGSWDRNSLKFNLLFYFEKLMSRKAKVLIAAAQGMEHYAKIKYRIIPTHFYVKPACVDLELFNLSKQKNFQLTKDLALKNKIVLVYAGKLGGIYLDKEVFDFIKVLYNFYGDALRFLLLTSHEREEIDYFCENSSLPSEIVISKFVEHSEIPYYMGLADFALNPVRPVPTKICCTSAKDGEYWAMGLPIIITKGISDDSYIIENENIGVVIETLDINGYHLALKKINVLLKSDRNELSKKIRAVAIKYRSFDIADKIYAKLYH
jgi:glycosyltransferase involved in cell wall biosynthesis